MERPGDSIQDGSALAGGLNRQQQQRAHTPAKDNRAQILVVSPKRQVRDRLTGFLSTNGCGVRSVRSASDARSMLHECAIDLALIDAALGEAAALELCSAFSRNEPGVLTIILSDAPTLDLAIQAMRHGAIDLIPAGIDSAELFEHIHAGLNRTQSLRERERRALRLRGLCLRLNSARQEVSRHVGELCSDLVEAYQDLATQLDHIGMSSELNCLLRQELDLEALLRTTLEYLLSKVGSTNAAIFLPSSTGEFSLGAYVNYDRAREEAEVMLDHLASAFAPRFEDQAGSVWIRQADELQLWMGDESHWLEDCETLVVPCHEGGECLAVLTAFRKRHTQFTDADRIIIETLGKLFGKQLARVISIHHRHIPKDKWGAVE